MNANREMVFEISMQVGNGYGHFHLQPMYRKNDAREAAEWGQNQGFSYFPRGNYDDKVEWNNFTVYCQWNTWLNSGMEIDQPYAFQFGFMNTSIIGANEYEIEQASRQLNTVKMVTRKYEKLVNDFGEPQTFGDFAILVAKACGAVGFIVRDGRETSSHVRFISFKNIRHELDLALKNGRVEYY